MQQSDGTIERGRNRWRATRFQVCCAEMLGHRMMMLLLRPGRRRKRKSYRKNAKKSLHLRPPEHCQLWRLIEYRLPSNRNSAEKGPAARACRPAASRRPRPISRPFFRLMPAPNYGRSFIMRSWIERSCVASGRPLPIAQRLDQQSERRRGLTAAWVIEVVAGEGRTPVRKHTDETAVAQLLAH